MSFAASSNGLALDEVELGTARLDLDRQRLARDPLAVFEEAGVGLRDRQPDPVRELEAQLLPLRVHGVDEVVDTAAQKQVVVELRDRARR